MPTADIAYEAISGIRPKALNSLLNGIVSATLEGEGGEEFLEEETDFKLSTLQKSGISSVIPGIKQTAATLLKVFNYLACDLEGAAIALGLDLFRRRRRRGMPRPRGASGPVSPEERVHTLLRTFTLLQERKRRRREDHDHTKDSQFLPAFFLRHYVQQIALHSSHLSLLYGVIFENLPTQPQQIQEVPEVQTRQEALFREALARTRSRTGLPRNLEQLQALAQANNRGDAQADRGGDSVEEE